MLRSAAYRSGDELRDGEIVHDYRAKGGVVHSEIFLPDHAPPEYADRQTLWNAVDASEKRKDARLAKEINVALPLEFSLDEQIEVLREYIQENFVSKGIIVDLNIHDKGDGNLNSLAKKENLACREAVTTPECGVTKLTVGVASGVRNQKPELARSHAANPHAHIMFTTRHVSPEGFGKKNTDLDSRVNLLIWRENWADDNNRMFERKGLDERIDHRTLKAQGIDREPTIHLGHEATALERQGIKTKRGDRNREIQQRNLERAQKAKREQELTESSTDEEPIRGLTETAPNETPDEEHTAEKAEPMWESTEITSNENPAEEIIVEKTVQHLNNLREDYITLEKELAELITQRNEERQEIPRLTFRAENIDEHAKNIEALQSRITELQETRQNLNFLQWVKKQEADKAIKHAEKEALRAQIFFKNRFGTDHTQAPEEIKRINEKVREKESDLILQL
ncbi:MAG: MobA/MobL family protein [Nitrososphaerota archaeon]|nr:MobA/MobL family protein [Nitrososphaerota archaeon]